MMIHDRCGAALAVLGLCGAAAGQATYKDSASFLAALAGRATVTEGFESAPFGLVIPEGSQFDGLTWSFSLVGPAEGGLVANTYAVIDIQGLFVERDGQQGPGTDDYFYLPESVTVTFPEPVVAAGVYFNIGPGDAVDYCYMQTPAGTAFSGGPVNEETLYPYMFFAGIIADKPFTTATFGVTELGPTGWNADNLIYAPGGGECYADINGDGGLDLFDFLAFTNLFNDKDPAADCDPNGVFDLFDFLCYTNAFNEGC